MTELRRRRVHLRDGTTDESTLRDVIAGFHLPPDAWPAPRTVLDLGCNCGLTIVDYALEWPQARIIGYELDYDNCQAARVNADGLAEIVHCAVSTYDGEATYDHQEGEWGYRIGGGDRRVRVMSLDSIYDRHFPGGVDFLKIDIEGEEKTLLEQAAFARWPAQTGSLYVELHGWPSDDALSLLNGAGFDQVTVSDRIEWGVFARRTQWP